jgi:Mg2+ and Co2+ transporter CorA
MGRSIIYDNLPELGSPVGFFFYSFLAYMLVLFLSWLMKEDPRDIEE